MWVVGLEGLWLMPQPSELVSDCTVGIGVNHLSIWQPQTCIQQRGIIRGGGCKLRPTTKPIIDKRLQ